MTNSADDRLDQLASSGYSSAEQGLLFLAVSCHISYYNSKKPSYQPIELQAYICIITHMGRQGLPFCTPRKCNMMGQNMPVHNKMQSTG